MGELEEFRVGKEKKRPGSRGAAGANMTCREVIVPATGGEGGLGWQSASQMDFPGCHVHSDAMIRSLA